LLKVCKLDVEREDCAPLSNPDRLSPLDASFLHFEDAGAHMHVGSVVLFEGRAPAHEELTAAVERRLHLVPRYRQKLAFPPLAQARPVWIDDPHFNPGYHIRHTALPAPAGEEELRKLAGRVFAQRLDRSKPLWEIWLVDRVGGDGFALISKTHHCLVDGVSGVDIASVLFDLEADPAPPPEPPPHWTPRPEPSAATLVADALAERLTGPLGALQAAGAVAADPAKAAAGVARTLGGMGSFLRAGVSAPPSPFNRPIGPHRSFAFFETPLDHVKQIKTGLGGTVNDVVLAAVAGGLRRWLLADGHEVGQLTLRAMVPMSTRAEEEHGALGNRVTTMYAPLPVGVPGVRDRFRIVHEAMAGLKESGQAVGADVLTQLTGFAPPTVLAQAARLQVRQRLFNLTVTNVPGPQFPLYLLGRRLRGIYPQVPIAANTTLGIALMSYDGTLCFGLLSDFDALREVGEVGDCIQQEIAALAAEAGLTEAKKPRRRKPVART
jgi:WS/DGAT/MGAT family acyltransferase